MKRQQQQQQQQPYAAEATMSPYMGSSQSQPQQQHVSGSQRIEHHPNSGGGYSGRVVDPYKSSSSTSSKLEPHWQLDSNAAGAQFSSSRGFNQGGTGTRVLPHQQDMEIRYDGNASAMSFEGLERKFLDEITKLAKEQYDAEDVENARHRERIIEINTRYQEKLSTLRAQHANRREELLCKESQARLSQFQKAGMSHYPISSLQDSTSYGGPAVGNAAGEAHRAYSSGQYESFRDRPQFDGSGRAQGTDGRVPYPEGRIYNNNAGARYY